MTLRRLHVLVSQLPPDSRTKAKLAGDREGRRWSESTHLQADQHELLQLLRIEQISAGLPKEEQHKVPKLQRVPRPGHGDDADHQGDSASGPEDLSPEDLADRYERIQRYLAQFDPPTQ